MLSRREAARTFFLAAAVSLAAVSAADAGGFRLEPGSAARVDTGERQQYTTITISNPDRVPGRLVLADPVNQTVDVPPGGTAELYGLYNRGVVAVTNTGPSRLEVVSRYMETWRSP